MDFKNQVMKSQKQKKRRNTLIAFIIILALAISGLVCGYFIGKNNKNMHLGTNDTTSTTTDDTSEAPDTTATPLTDDTTIDDSVTEPISDTLNDPDTPIMTDYKLISEGGTEPGLWPDEIPDDVPEINDYNKLLPSSEEKWGNFTIWSTGVMTDKETYEDWKTQLENQGFKPSETVNGYWTDGETILDVTTEETEEGFFVGVDVHKPDPIIYPECISYFPTFETDGTVYTWDVEHNDGETKLTITYIDPTDFNADFESYKLKLSDNGYDIGEMAAIKTIDGKEYLFACYKDLKKISYTFPYDENYKYDKTV